MPSTRQIKVGDSVEMARVETTEYRGRVGIVRDLRGKKARVEIAGVNGDQWFYTRDLRWVPSGLSFSWDTLQGEVSYDESRGMWTLAGAPEGYMSSILAHLILSKMLEPSPPRAEDQPRGKIALSISDPTAQDLLWEYAQRRRTDDADFADDLEQALHIAGYTPTQVNEEPKEDSRSWQERYREAMAEASVKCLEKVLGETSIRFPVGSRVMNNGQEGVVEDLQCSSQIDTDNIPRGRYVRFADGRRLVHVDDLIEWPKGTWPRSTSATKPPKK